MHATTHELLNLRDAREVHPALAAHVRACRECGSELARLQALSQGLRGLPQRHTPPDRWESIQQALRQHAAPAPVRKQTSERPGLRMSGWLVPAGGVAALALAVVVTWRTEQTHLTVNTDDGVETPLVGSSEETPAQALNSTRQAAPSQITASPETVAQLEAVPAQQTDANPWLAESQRLERVLAQLPEEPTVTRATTALTLAELEDRIRWVDYRLAASAEEEEQQYDEQASRQLWRERVDLLNSMVAVRYAQTAF